MSATEKSPTLPRAISVVGPSGSGKTALICELLGWLRRRGLRVAVVKHSHKPLEVDQSGKDSWRFRQAGAPVVALAAPGVLQLTHNRADDPPLATVLAALGPDLDLVLVEGYKYGPLPKLVLVPEGASFDSEPGYPRVIGYVCDQILPTAQPVFSRRQVAEIAAFLLKQERS